MCPRVEPVLRDGAQAREPDQYDFVLSLGGETQLVMPYTEMWGLYDVWEALNTSHYCILAQCQ